MNLYKFYSDLRDRFEKRSLTQSKRGFSDALLNLRDKTFLRYQPFKLKLLALYKIRRARSLDVTFKTELFKLDHFARRLR